jgi:predicted metal-dependent hydrolase
MSAKRIARRLQRRIDQPLEVTLTDNVSRMLSVSRRDETLRVRMHHMFTHAGMRTLHAVARYIQTGGEQGRDTIRDFVSSHQDTIRDRTRRVTITTRGEHFDLEALRDEVYAEHFADQDPPHITWSRTTRGKNKCSIQFGSFDPGKDLVRINPKLDASFVPEYYMKYLIFHEILHREIPPRPGDVHTEEYQEALRRFPHYERATRWEEENLHRFVRSAEKRR